LRWDDRDPENPYYRIGITCHSCGKDSYTNKTNAQNPEWSGLCADCLGNRVLPQKRRKLKGKYINPFGAEIDWDASHEPNRALVRCPNFSVCGGEEQKIANDGNKDLQPFYCRACLTAHRRAGIRAAWASLKGTASGNGQEKGSAGKKIGSSGKVGRPRKFTDQQALDAMDTLDSRVSVSALARKLQCTRAPINDWVHDQGYPSLDKFVEARRRERM